MVILWCGVEVTVVLLLLVMAVVVGVVLLRCGVVVVVVVLLALDVGIGEEERRRGGGSGVLGRGYARCQGRVALDGAIPAGGAGLRGRRQEAAAQQEGDGGRLRVKTCRGLSVVVVVVVASPGAVASVDAPGQVVVAVVSTGVVEEISPGAETVTVDHPSWSLGGWRVG